MNFKTKNIFSNFNFSLFGVLLLTLLIPSIYSTVRIYFLGNLPNDWGFNIASQLAWINVIYEIIQEALILPLFFIIGTSLSQKENLENKIKTGLIISFLVYFAISLFIYIFAKPLLVFMSQKDTIMIESTRYIRLETIAITFSILYRFIFVIFVMLKKIKSILLLLLFQMIFTIICDTFLISSKPFSLNLGVNGVAATNIIVNIILFVFSLILLNQFEIVIINKSKLSFSWMKKWIKIGALSGIESFVRNFAFVIMILKMVNIVQEQGTYWIANQFIWGWLLLPILALGKLIKRDSGENPNKINERLPSYFYITSMIIIIWLITIPFWNTFIKNVMNISNSLDIVHVALISILFYIIFAYNNIIDSIFYGIGRTDLMLFQSLAVNIFYYGSMFVLFKLKIFVPSIDKIALMFGIGLALDSILTFFMYWYFKRNNSLKDANGKFT